MFCTFAIYLSKTTWTPGPLFFLPLNRALKWWHHKMRWFKSWFTEVVHWGGSRTILRVDVNLLSIIDNRLTSTRKIVLDPHRQRTVCTSADKIWRPTRVHTWSDFVFDLHQWLAQLFTSVKDPTLCGRCCPFLRWLQYRKHKYRFE